MTTNYLNNETSTPNTNLSKHVSFFIDENEVFPSSPSSSSMRKLSNDKYNHEVLENHHIDNIKSNNFLLN